MILISLLSNKLEGRHGLDPHFCGSGTTLRLCFSICKCLNSECIPGRLLQFHKVKNPRQSRGRPFSCFLLHVSLLTQGKVKPAYKIQPQEKPVGHGAPEEEAATSEEKESVIHTISEFSLVTAFSFSSMRCKDTISSSFLLARHLFLSRRGLHCFSVSRTRFNWK